MYTSQQNRMHIHWSQQSLHNTVGLSPKQFSMINPIFRNSIIQQTFIEWSRNSEVKNKILELSPGRGDKQTKELVSRGMTRALREHRGGANQALFCRAGKAQRQDKVAYFTSLHWTPGSASTSTTLSSALTSLRPTPSCSPSCFRASAPALLSYPKLTTTNASSLCSL